MAMSYFHFSLSFDIMPLVSIAALAFGFDMFGLEVSGIE